MEENILKFEILSAVELRIVFLLAWTSCGVAVLCSNTPDVLVLKIKASKE